jgi:aminomethyltransferase
LSLLFTSIEGKVNVDDSLKRTPLYDKHVALGAKMVPFGGWDMPVQYTGIKDEHNTVRARAGLFDVSHMGEFEVRGPNLVSFINYVSANDASKLDVGQAQYSMFLNAQGGTIDDIIVYRVGEEYALIVVNAGNIEKDWAHVSAVAEGFEGVTVTNRSDDYGLLAIQGPNAVELINSLTDIDVSEIQYYGVREAQIGDFKVIVARTGYTGEDGFELFVQGQEAAALWDRLLEEGKELGLAPAGLGARDTLRLEASMPLYGHELNDDTSPIEAGLGYFVAKQGDYIGAERQRELRKGPLGRKLVMLKLTDRGIAREGYKIYNAEGEEIGQVTSGSMTPYLNVAIAQAYVHPDYSKVDSTVYIDIRGKHIPAVVVTRPFYKRDK